MTTLVTAVDPLALPAVASSAAGERLHALDSLRAAAMLLGIVLHAGGSLALIPIPWPARDVSSSEGFNVLLGSIHGFRMQVFFLLAGFFAHLAWRRLGTRGFLAQRGQRIGLPFAAGMLVLIPLIGAIWLWGDSRSGSTYAMGKLKDGSLMTYPTGHLWFLEMLLILYVAAMLIVRFARPNMAAILPKIDTAFDWLMRQWWKPLLLAVPTVALLWGGPHIGEIDTAGVFLLPAYRAVAYYALFFAVGWWLHRRLPVLDALRRWLPLYFGIALVTFFMWGIGIKAAAAPGAAEHITAIKIVGLTGAALYSWCMTFAMTGLFLRIANGHRSWVRYLADASYWWYLWHLPIVLALQIWIATWPVNGWLKLLLMLVITMAILWPSYHYLVRYTWIGRVLNGPRERKPA
ncbi:MAG TPA: acyltransferase family protein [Ramlibacter sp.]|nr:acyltransferase family protein [Ramlibacter sp.]